MNRWIPCSLVMMAIAFGAQPEGPRVLDAKRYHLGTAGMAEWQHFEGQTPHGRQLDLSFSTRANPGESTLLIRQRDVKGAWSVLVNGSRVGSLEALSQPLVRAITIPGGLLRDGANQLSIVPRAMVDDIVVGEITFDPRPLAEVLGDATLEFEVTDADGAGLLPCRLTLTDNEGALIPVQPRPGQRLAVRTGAPNDAVGSRFPRYRTYPIR